MVYDLQLLTVSIHTPEIYCARCGRRIEGPWRDYLLASMDDDVAYYHLACAAHVLNRYAAFAATERARIANDTTSQEAPGA